MASRNLGSFSEQKRDTRRTGFLLSILSNGRNGAKEPNLRTSFVRVDAAVDIAKPGGDEEGRVARMPVRLQLDADGVDDVAGEKRSPAD